VPSAPRSLLQLAGAILCFVGFWAASYRAIDLSPALSLALALPAAGFMVRLFIIQHDCGHGSFFRSARANSLAGMLCSLFTLTPFQSWRRQHAGHHGQWNNLDRRSGLDMYSDCLTVREYRLLPPARRFTYRLLRHPVVAHLLVPPLVFLLLYRTAFDTPRDWRRERRSIHATNIAIAAMVALLGWRLGFGPVAIVELSIVLVAAIAGVWLFGLQHKFEGAAWTRQSEWDFTTAALSGTSCLRLPAWLQWFTGNIGFHHIHHLNPRVPNYRLQEAYEQIPSLRPATTLTLIGGLRAVRYVLWDEGRGKLVRFRDASAEARPAQP
jgi:omega-6 fatty acid desaturase (delta-12 desaturase)